MKLRTKVQERKMNEWMSKGGNKGEVNKKNEIKNENARKKNVWAVRTVQSLSACTVEPIPLLPLWAVQPVENLSACTVDLYLYSPYGPYGLYRASVPVQ
jgi:hypothetical protein